MDKIALKYLVLAQIASDAGKLLSPAKLANGLNAISKGYDNKVQYISLACKYAASGYKNIAIYYCTQNDVIFFQIKGIGQISFHTFTNKFKKYAKNPQISWDQKLGGSRKTCKKIIKIYKLPYKLGGF